MLTTEDGRFFYTVMEHSHGFSAISTVVVGNLTVAGNTVSGTEQSADFFSEQCQTYTKCPTGPVVAVTGTISQRSTMTLDGYTWTYSSLYDGPSSLATTAGTWSGDLAAAAINVALGTLDIGSNGVLFDQDPTTNCLVKAQISIINPSYNAYAIALTYMGTDCPPNFNGATASGIAYIDDLGELNIGVNVPGAAAIVETVAAPIQADDGIWSGVSVPSDPPNPPGLPDQVAYMISDEGGRFFFRATDFDCTYTYDGTFGAPTPVNPTLIGGAIIQMIPATAGPSASCGGVANNGYYLFLDPASSMLNVQNNNEYPRSYDLTPQTVTYNQTSSAALVEGNWTTPSGDTLVVDSSGAISETDASSGCVVAGQISSANPAHNLYYLTLHYSGCTGVPADLAAFTSIGTGLNGAFVTGLATIDTVASPRQLDLWYRIEVADGSGTSALIYYSGTSN